jgi:hypothetical protein
MHSIFNYDNVIQKKIIIMRFLLNIKLVATTVLVLITVFNIKATTYNATSPALNVATNNFAMMFNTGTIPSNAIVTLTLTFTGNTSNDNRDYINCGTSLVTRLGDASTIYSTSLPATVSFDISSKVQGHDLSTEQLIFSTNAWGGGAKTSFMYGSMTFSSITLTVTLPVPTITSFSPASGAVGSSVTITGSNFNTTAANNVVYFGATKAIVTAASATSLTVTVPVGATYQNISVTDITSGKTGYSAKPFITTFNSTQTIDANSFSVCTDYTTGGSTVGIAAGDLDGDGKPDLVVAGYGYGSISVYPNTSSGGAISFGAKTDYASGTWADKVIITDIDGDGKPDVAVVNGLASTISIFRNTSTLGSISFAAKVDLITGSTPFDLTFADFDGDGKPDLAATNAGSNTVSVFLNTSSIGTISFAAKSDFSAGTYTWGIAAGDIDGDGKPDIVAVNRNSTSISVFTNISSTGIISFAAKVDYTTGATPYYVAISDLDADGKADVIVANGGASSISVFKNNSTSGSVSLASKVDYAALSTASGVSVSDIDGDGKPDVVVSNYGANSTSILKNTSTTGTITLASKVDFQLKGGSYLATIADFDGDGKPDIAGTIYQGSVFSVIQNTTGIPLTTAPTSSAASAITTTGFTANWSTLSGAYKYYLDVATDNAFSSMVTGYNNLDVTNVTNYAITGLTAGNTYYYRVRGYNGSTSPSSSTITVTTSKLDQTITFGSLPSATYGDADINPGATASSGLAITYSSSNLSIATIVSGQIHIVGQGTVTIYADQAGNSTYNVAPQASQSLTINKKALTVTGTSITSKVYDGATTATISGATLSGVVGSDAVTLGNATSGTFASANVANGISVTTAMTISGAASGNYTLTQPTLTGNITAKALTVTGASVTSKVYDGATTATISGATLSGEVGSDAVTLGNATSGTFASANVANGISVTTAMTISGVASGNYTLTQPTLTGNITTKSLIITGVTAENKVYDGTNDATLTVASLSGVVGSDDVSLTAGTGTFDDKNVGTGKTVTASGFDITGVDAGNYTLSAQPTGLTADITAKSLDITGVTAGNKVYDGITDATLSAGTLSGVVGSDNVTITAGTGVFADKNVGVAKTVTASGYAIAGADVNNYSLSGQPSGLTADIAKRPITITANSGQSKKEGTQDTEFTYTITSGSLVNGESLTGSLTRVAGEGVGSYAIELGTLSAGDNYTITFVSADFTIEINTGTITISEQKPLVYPNPTVDVVKVDVSGGNFTVLDLNGKVVLESTLDDTKTIDLGQYSSGVYVLIVRAKSGVYQYKIVKK